MAYAISGVISKDNDPSLQMRFGWAIGMGLLTLLLLFSAEGAIDTLQRFIVITAAPVTFILLPTAILSPIAVWKQQKSELTLKQ